MYGSFRILHVEELKENPKTLTLEGLNISGDVEISLLKARLEETEKAMERIVAQVRARRGE